MFTKRSHITILFLFVTFLVMNPITFNNNTFLLVGKYGKLFTAIIGIFVLQKSRLQIKYFTIENIYLMFFWGICMLFLVVRTIELGIDFALIQNNVLFIVFIYFLYLLSMTFRIRHRRPKFYFFKYLALVLNINFFFWLTIAFIFGFNSWSEGPRTGLELFYDSYIQLGIFSCTAAIANFALMRYKTYKNRKIYFIMFVLYSVLVILSNSRNAQLVLCIFLLLNLLPYIRKIAIKYIYFLVFGLLIVLFFYFSGEILLIESITYFTSGRSTIWFHVYEYYLQHSIFIGEGIFGLNDTILIANADSNYYFADLTFLYFHSSYIEVITAGGIIGLVFFTIFIIKSLRERKKYYVVIIIISILIGGIFESYLLQPTILISFLFWYLIIGETRVLSRR